ncbi:unnamed protein product [Clavelina lepadiformis]|uniref:ZZ-type zinc finger-containing protein 3 n=1 Tax=Clavelina lepadiformis TaxID=159417 RepID=A0ABP0F9X3_CLALP
MKPSKGSTVFQRTKRHSGCCAAQDSSPIKQAGSVAARTRSSSSVDTSCMQRSTRSTPSQAFFELQYHSKRSLQDSESDKNPKRRSKRSSTCSSSSSMSSEVELSINTASTPCKKIFIKPSPQLINNLEKDTNFGNLQSDDISVIQTNNSTSINVDLNSCHLNGLCNSHSELFNCNGNGVQPNQDQHKDKPMVVNGHNGAEHKSRNKFEWSDAKNAIPNSKSSVPKENGHQKLSNIEACEISTNDDSYTCSTLLKKSSRKRHLSEQIPQTLRRNRRLSERGEMASVVEFLFKQTKSLCTREATDSHPQTSFKNCNSSFGNHLAEVQYLNNGYLVEEASVTAENTSDHEANCDVSESMNSKDTDSKTHSIQTPNKNNMFMSKEQNHCDLDRNSDKESESEGEDNQCVKPRKRSLRSSGIKCQPDYYALSLNLMIHRPRKAKQASTEHDENLSVVKLDAGTEEITLIDDKSDKQENHQEVDKLTLKPVDTADATQVTETAKTENTQTVSFQKSKHVQNNHVAITPPTATASQSGVSNILNSRRRVCGRGRGRYHGRSLHRITQESDVLESSQLFDEEPPSGPDAYYFESDHVALKQNEDYHNVLRIASLLEAQRKQALADIQSLKTKLHEGLDNPIGFVDILQRQVDVHLPKNLIVPSIPEIDWSKYTSQFGTFDHVFSSQKVSSKPFTRRKKINFSSGAIQVSENSSTTSNSISKSRSQTFKKSWSVEEQRKLEELLLKYPQEAVEFHRFRKIAAELGGRTPLQVQSRVQKYFIKLAKAGLPIPGRMPRIDRLQSCKPRHLHKHRSHPQASLTRISTFFTDFHVPVRMQDGDDDNSRMPSNGPAEDDDGGWETIKSEQVSDEEDVPNELRYSDEYLEILRLKRKRQGQLRLFDTNGNQLLAQHYGYQCDVCQCEPIRGLRYHCIDCPSESSVDLCQSCIRNQRRYETAVHKANHRLEPVYASVIETAENTHSLTDFESRPYADGDYVNVATSCGEYNYLDSNYLPQSG